MNDRGRQDPGAAEALAIDIDQQTMAKLELARELLSAEAGHSVSVEETVLQALRVLVEDEQNAALTRQHAPRPRR
jgi:hypothetical protein